MKARQARLHRIAQCICKSFLGRCIKRACRRFAETICVRRCTACCQRCLNRCVARFPCLKHVINAFGFVWQRVSGTPPSSARQQGSVVGSSGRRAATGGVATLEETLLKFGFDIKAQEDDKLEEDDNRNKDPHAMGLEEVQREIGTEEWKDEDEMQEEELELRTDDDGEAEDMNDDADEDEYMEEGEEEEEGMEEEEEDFEEESSMLERAEGSRDF